MVDEEHINTDPLNLPHLVRVCDAANDPHSIPPPEATKGFYDTFDPPTVLALLRRLMEAEARVRELEGL